MEEIDNEIRSLSTYILGFQTPASAASSIIFHNIGEFTSPNTADVIDKDIANVVDEILEEVPDVIQESFYPEELHHMAQKAFSAVSPHDIPSTCAGPCIGNSEREKPPPLSNNSIHCIVEDGVFQLLPTEDEEQEEEESDASSLEDEEQEEEESNALNLEDECASVDEPAATKRKRQRPK